MTMRGTTRRAIAVDVQRFVWDRAAVATLRHSTLPWRDGFARGISLDATPLAALKDPGDRDRLSLLGQFAAHEAFLQFAGVSDGEFDPDEWAVVRKRGTDCRLVRVAARTANESPPVLSSIQQFATAMGAPMLAVLRQSWGRAEMVYQEIHSRLRADAAADLRWLRCAAYGCVLGPGPDALRNALAESGGRFRFDDDDAAFSALAVLDSHVIILGKEGSPLERFSAIRPLANVIGPFDGRAEREIVERVIAAGHHLFVISRPASFDEGSRRVVDLLLAANVGVWIGTEGQDLPETSWFLLSPRLAGRREVERRLQALPSLARQQWLETLVHSPAFVRYLDEGALPARAAGAMGEIREPLRSFIAAVALLGPRVPVVLVDRFLERLLSTARATNLVIAGVTAIVGDEFAFASEETHQEAMGWIPAGSRPSLCRVAAEAAFSFGDRRQAASLLVEAGDHGRAVELLEQMEWCSASEVIETLRRLPKPALSSRLAQTLCEALIESGRYRDAQEFAVNELLLARIERRAGDYTPALARLERMPERDFDCELLRAELLFLTDRYDDAGSALDACVPETDDQRIRHGYQRAVLANEIGTATDDVWLDLRGSSREYHAARLVTYRAVTARDLDSAMQSARRAVECARSVLERIDATLDLLFALFCSGRWTEARAAALDALLLVEETQGDRAGGGILFLLAYLSADDGQWTHASHLLERLRRFYGEMRDEKRLVELELLAAQIDFARGRFAAAERAAERVTLADVSDQIREAAALIVDEIAWIEKREAPLRSKGTTANVELNERHAIERARRGLEHQPLRSFFARLFAWEERAGIPPEPANGSETLMLFRSALGCGRKKIADPIAARLKITLDSFPERVTETELRMLRAASTLAFPFAKDDLGAIGWRYATRNRLGQWHEIGSLPPLSAAELDRLLTEPEGSWIACSDRELLYIEDLDRWSSESRGSIAALFRVRAEHHRLRRLLDEEAGEVPRQSVEGIVGESSAMREIYALISRLAKRDVPVCILGESGTGKELVARAIHRQCQRRQKPFMAVNCAALPENLIESELFGHIRGAFTGADRDRPGLIETTDGGTLFLDEIGEMPLAAQAKLLRFLQEGEFRRVGDTVNRSADVRVVTATNRKLEASVEQGRFREDLYYRVRGVEIVLPPLRDRISDISLLASHFLAMERQKHRSGPIRLSSEAEGAFASYHWPGNVRELQNTIRAAHALAGEAKEIDLEHLPERLRRIKIARTPLGSYQDAVARFRRELIEKSLAQVNGNQNRAAAMLKISRQALAYQIRELGILVTPSKRPRP